MADEGFEDKDLVGKYALISGSQGNAVVRLIRTDPNGGSRPYSRIMIVDEAEIIVGAYVFPAAFMFEEVVLSSDLSEVSQAYLGKLRRHREALYRQIEECNRQYAQDEGILTRYGESREDAN